MPRTLLAVCACLWGCAAPTPAPAGQPPAAAPAPAASASSGAEVAAPATFADMSGQWVEFWALEGQADTQRYALLPDGRFEWTAARAGDSPFTRRWGRWQVQGDALVLQCEGQEQRTGCTGDACRVLNDPAHEERVQLGECPPNEEAAALDPSYRCVSIAGHAWWQKGGTGRD